MEISLRGLNERCLIFDQSQNRRNEKLLLLSSRAYPTERKGKKKRQRNSEIEIESQKNRELEDEGNNGTRRRSSRQRCCCWAVLAAGKTTTGDGGGERRWCCRVRPVVVLGSCTNNLNSSLVHVKLRFVAYRGARSMRISVARRSGTRRRSSRQRCCCWAVLAAGKTTTGDGGGERRWCCRVRPVVVLGSCTNNLNSSLVHVKLSMSIEINNKHHVAYVHMQNGLVESLIKHIQLFTRPIFMYHKRPKSTWGHAMYMPRLLYASGQQIIISSSLFNWFAVRNQIVPI
ncbi:hypothetical protein LXL04_002625 [Taraxacum kok-saghyz]